MTETLQLRVHGDESLPTLIHLPGLHGDWTLVASFRVALTGRARFVETTYPRTITWSLEDYTEAVETALLSRGIQNGWLIGESYGSQIAWNMIARAAAIEDPVNRGTDAGRFQPVAASFSLRLRENRGAEAGRFQPQGLILAGGFVRHPTLWAVRMAGHISRAVPLRLVKSCCCVYARYANYRHRRAPETLANIAEFVARRTIEADRDAIAHRYRLIAESDFRPVARQTRLPVFYLAGLVDPLVPWPIVRLWLRRNCPGYRGGRTIWRADHNVLGTAPQASAEQILQWISEQTASSRAALSPQSSYARNPFP